MAFAQQLLASSRVEARGSSAGGLRARSSGVAGVSEAASGGKEVVLLGGQPQAPVVAQAPAPEGMFSSLERWLKVVGGAKR